MENSQLKPQDLRYGNLIEAQGKIFTVKAIERFIVTATRGKGNVDFTYAEVNPIPITEEIILMAGFLLKEDGNFWIENPCALCLHTKDNEFYVLLEQRRVFIEHLHELQNFYILSGEELEINLK